MNGRSKRTDEEPCDGRISDRQLLGRFVDHDDEDAFARLVARYCGLVLGVCRRTLRDEQSAEDAFQATFLVLARRASRVRNRSSLAGWLCAVAYRTALRARAKRLRRREQPLRDDMTATDDILARVTSRYEQQLLDEELDRLPAKYREPLVLRYLMGKSNNEVARELGLKLGVVEGRLKRGKDRLRLNLAKRGIGLTVALAAVGASATVAEAATTESLLAATVQAAAAFRSGARPTGNYSQNAIRLAEQELAMSTSTVAVTTSGVAAALVLVGLTLGLAGDAADQSAHAQPPEIAASASIDSSAAASAEAGHVPVLLAPAEKQKGESDANEVGTAGTTDDPAESEAILRAKYGATDMKSRPRAEQSILDALETPTELAFIDTPLQDVIDTLKDFHKIEIQIDQRALDEVGIPSDTPITKSLKGVSLRSALRLMLRELDLTYVIVDEVMLITTPEVADAMMETHVYSLHLLDELDSDELARVIQNTIRPDTWRTGELSDETSSSSTAKASKGPPLAAIEALPGCLVITQSQHAHEEIAELLEQLERYQTGTRMLQQAPGD